MKHLLLVSALFTVSGCVAKNGVLKTAEWDEYDRSATGGVVFSLPQARLRLDYTLTRKTFIAGTHTSVVDYCASETDISKGKRICKALSEAGISASLRLSDLSKPFCKTDGSLKEARIVMADDATLTTDYIPDDSETYVIPLQRSYFQNFDFDLELNSNGTVGTGSLTTDNLGAQDFVASFTELAGSLNGMSIAAQDQQSEQSPTTREFNQRGADAAEGALRQLLKLQQARDEITARNNDAALPSRAVQLSALDAWIARDVASFVGELRSTKEADVQTYWIPHRATPPNSVESAAERDEPATTCEASAATLDTIAAAQWVGPVFDACGTDEHPRRQLVAVKVKKCDNAPLASGSFDSTAFANARGWPYRVPQEVDIEWRVCSGNEIAASTDPLGILQLAETKCKKVNVFRQFLPQFGLTLRLPEKTGGRKSAIAPAYYIDGSLKKLTISHVGESPAPLITAVNTALMPAPTLAEPTETAKLTAESELITARQALCQLVFAVPANDPLCLGPNPPTSRPERD